jgi:hypothetical protein
MLTHQRLKELLHYNQETGVFTRLVQTTNNVEVGSIAGSYETDQRYIRITVDNKSYKAHRLAFLYMTEDWPLDEVDHINGLRDDNRWVNLRAATKTQNMRNVTTQRKNNTSGYKGVSWYEPNKKWAAKIRVNKRLLHLGYFATPESANDVYCAAAQKYHGEFSRVA